MTKKVRGAVKSENKIVEFQRTIELYRRDVDSYLEAVAAFCEKNGVDELEVIPLISPSLKEKIRKECVVSRILKPEQMTIEF